jgi:glycosyltransferase involved in cell wall biosynthesis
MTSQTTIYFDLSDLLEYARTHETLSGVQRVAVMLLNRVLASRGPAAVRILAFHPDRKVMLSYGAEFFAGAYDYSGAELCRVFGVRPRAGGGPQTLEGYVLARYGRGARAWLHRRRLAAANLASGGASFRRRGIVAPGAATPAAGDPPRLGPGDVVFVPGATWGVAGALAFMRDQAARGVHYVQFIHDLIPLRAPEHVIDGLPEQFTEWLRELTAHAAGFIANSEATRADLLAYFDQRALAPKPCHVVRLAHEFPSSGLPDYAGPDFLDAAHAAPAPIRAAVYNAARLPFALCVGTLESRKNAWTLARVWLSIADELKEGAPRLLFVGAPGWLSGEFEELMRATGWGGGLIVRVERPTDAELAYLYGACLFSVFPSYYEGWGLPIGESLWFGKPVACSRAGSMPEVGGEFADYFDPGSFTDMRATILRLVCDADYRARRAADIDRSALRTWGDAADDLWWALSATTTLGRRTAPVSKT